MFLPIHVHAPAPKLKWLFFISDFCALLGVDPRFRDPTVGFRCPYMFIEVNSSCITAYVRATWNRSLVE
jgi:hypothetical protein